MTYTARKRREARNRRHYRIRKTLQGTAARPRLSVYRSNKHIFAQLIDDSQGHTLAAAGSTESALRPAGNTTTEVASRVGAQIAMRAKEAGISAVVFDRGGFKYHGQIAALAEAAREEGLEF